MTNLLGSLMVLLVITCTLIIMAMMMPLFALYFDWLSSKFSAGILLFAGLATFLATVIFFNLVIKGEEEDL